VARVGGAEIREEDYARALRATAAGRREPPGREEAQHVLERLIDEELLVQRGLELGLAGRDPRLRAELSAAVIGLLVARAEMEALEPAEEALRELYEELREAFREPERFRVVRLRVDGPDQEARALALAERLRAGEPAERVARDADPAVFELPEGWVSADTLLEYLGPGTAAAVRAVEAGGVAGPVAASGGWEVVRVIARGGGDVRPFEAVTGEVREALRRRAGEVALRAFLEARRREVEVVVADRPRAEAGR
jgi:hypothetical protein